MPEWYDWVFEPILAAETFDVAQKDYFARGMGLWRELMRRRYVRSLPVNTWVNKGFVGLRAMLYHLGARVPMGTILREETSVKLPPAAGGV